jgi:hypothetical protein
MTTLFLANRSAYGGTKNWKLAESRDADDKERGPAGGYWLEG